MEKFPSPEGFSVGGKPRRFPQRFPALFHEAAERAKQDGSRGEDGFTHNRQPLLLLLLFSFILFRSVFVGTQCGGCAKLPAQKAVAGKAKRQTVFPNAPAVPSLPTRCGARGNHMRVPGRPEDADISVRPFRTASPAGQKDGCKTLRAPTVRVPEYPADADLTSFFLLRPFSGSLCGQMADAKKHTTKKNNSINPKGRNKCTLSFRKKCCWTI